MGTLNIFLHGLFAIVEEPYRVVLAVPHVSDHDTFVIQVQGDANAYTYGRGNYELLGVNRNPLMDGTPPVSFPEDKNAKIGKGAKHYTDVFTTAPPAYATFTLPRPMDIHSCQTFRRDVDLEFRGNHVGEITSQKFARMNVLTFPICDPEMIRFAGLPDFRAHYKPRSNMFVNVAIVSRGPHKDGPCVSAAFEQMMKSLIPGKDIHLYGLKSDPPNDDPCNNIPGADRATFDAFSSKQDFLPDDCVGLVVNNA